MRCIPEDDLLTRLAFSATGGRPLQMVFLFPPGGGQLCRLGGVGS
ncbi:MAG: hypothetical protein U1G05_14225 [Kiritimatiellia bacterium]